MNNVAILKNNYVINLIVVDNDHLQELDSVVYSLGGDNYVIYDENNPAYLGGDYYNNVFRPSQPEGNVYWHEVLKMWLLEDDDVEALLWSLENPYDPTRLDLRQA